MSDAHLACDRRKGKGLSPTGWVAEQCDPLHPVLRTCCSSALTRPRVGQQGCSWRCRSNWSSSDKADQMFVGTEGVFAVRLRKGFLLCFVVTNVTSTEIKASALKCSCSDFCIVSCFFTLWCIATRGRIRDVKAAFLGLTSQLSCFKRFPN